MSTAYQLHGNELHETTDARTHCQRTHRRTLAVVGSIRRSVLRIETRIDALRRRDEDEGAGQ